MEFYKNLYAPTELPDLDFQIFDDMWHGPLINDK